MDGISFRPLDSSTQWDRATGPDGAGDFASMLEQAKREQAEAQSPVQAVADQPSEGIATSSATYPNDANIADPNGVVPGGPWTPAAGQRAGSFYGPQQPGGRSMAQWVPSGNGGPPGSVGYWKTKTPSTPWMRFDQSGRSITPEQAHPNPPPSSTKTEAPTKTDAPMPGSPTEPVPEVPEVPFILPP